MRGQFIGHPFPITRQHPPSCPLGHNSGVKIWTGKLRLKSTPKKPAPAAGQPAKVLHVPAKEGRSSRPGLPSFKSASTQAKVLTLTRSLLLRRRAGRPRRGMRSSLRMGRRAGRTRSGSFGLRRLSLMRLRTRSRPALRSLCRFMRLSAGLSLRSPGSFVGLRSSTRSALRSLGSLMCFSSARPAFGSLRRLMRFRSTRPAHRSSSRLMRLSSTRLAYRSLSLIRTSRSLPALRRLRLTRASRLRLAHRSARGARTRTSRSRPALRRLRLMLAGRSGPALTRSRLSPSLSRPRRATRRHYTRARKLPRLRSSGNCRPSMVHRSQHRVISTRCPLMLRLRRRHPHMRIAPRSLLRSRGTSRQSSTPAVIAHPAHRPVIHRAARVNMRKASSANPVHRAIVVESSSVPIPALVPEPAIAKAIIDAAIEAHRRAPVTRIPQVSAAAPAPISRRPQHPNLGRLNPRSRNPVIALVAISPIARRPHITNLRTDRLLISHQRRRCDRNRHPNLRHRNRRQNRQQKSLQNQTNSTHLAPPSLSLPASRCE